MEVWASMPSAYGGAQGAFVWFLLDAESSPKLYGFVASLQPAAMDAGLPSMIGIAKSTLSTP